MTQRALPLPGSFLLAQSDLQPHSDHTHRLLGPTLPANTKFCLRFYFSLKGEPPVATRHGNLPTPR